MMDIESSHLNIDNRPNFKRERRVQSTSASDQATFPIPFQAQHCLCTSNHPGAQLTSPNGRLKNLSLLPLRHAHLS